MNTGLLYLPYLPNINWLRSFVNFDEVWIEREENFVKSTARNRCEIAEANGRHALSIPIIGGRDHRQLYKEVRIAYQNDWQHVHWQSIRSAYGSSPYFEHYADKFRPFYEKRYDLLFDYNAEILKLVLAILRIDKKTEFTFSYEKEPAGKADLRADSDAEWPHRYYQVFEERNGFIPNLSIIDLLMNEGPQAIRYLQKQ